MERKKERNNELLESKIRQKQLNDNIKKIVSLKYEIHENIIKEILLPSKSKNIYKILLYINTFKSIDIDKLKENNESKANDIFQELNNIIYLNTSF